MGHSDISPVFIDTLSCGGHLCTLELPWIEFIEVLLASGAIHIGNFIHIDWGVATARGTTCRQIRRWDYIIYCNLSLYRIYLQILNFNEL
jgi:hypothetical protein